MKTINYILYVDDDTDDHELFTQAMQRVIGSARIEILTNGLHALEKLRNTDSLPDIIFCDIIMPFMDGLSLVNEIRSSPGLENVAVVIYSSVPVSEYLEKSKDMNIAHCIQKPSTFEDICAELQQSLRIIAS